jgi:formylmethanofuran dehydrogenase subunit C
MSRVTLTLRNAPALRVDLRGLTPAALTGLSNQQIGQWLVTHGTQTLPLSEFFAVAVDGVGGDEATEIALDGDLSRFDRIGWQLAAGRIVVGGPVGDYAGACMTGGEVRVRGSAGMLAACEMAGGVLTIEGDVGDFAASNLPGSMDGMRGGTLIVRGHAGERFGDRMRRGTAVVFGDVGDFLASRLVAGTIAIGGAAGAHVGYGMRRGSIVFVGPAPSVSPTFVPAVAAADVFWQLLSRDLASHGGPFAGLPARRITRHLGDVSADGRGELILVA